MLEVFYRKVPELGQKKMLPYSVLAAISFRTYTAIPSFFPRFKSSVEVIFLNAVEYRLRFPWMSDTVSKRRPISFIFNLGSEITG
jgi:hypothetical protein